MNEEMMNENIVTGVEGVVNAVDEVTESGGGLLKFVAVTICAAGAAGAYLYKTRKQRKEKNEERMIKKLEAEGYTIYKPIDDVSEDIVEVEE